MCGEFPNGGGLLDDITHNTTRSGATARVLSLVLAGLEVGTVGESRISTSRAAAARSNSLYRRHLPAMMSRNRPSQATVVVLTGELEVAVATSRCRVGESRRSVAADEREPKQLLRASLALSKEIIVKAWCAARWSCAAVSGRRRRGVREAHGPRATAPEASIDWTGTRRVDDRNCFIEVLRRWRRSSTKAKMVAARSVLWLVRARVVAGRS